MNGGLQGRKEEWLEWDRGAMVSSEGSRVASLPSLAPGSGVSVLTPAESAGETRFILALRASRILSWLGSDMGES
jgi:hypothetical protein